MLVDASTGQILARLTGVHDAWWLDTAHLVTDVTTYDRAHPRGTDSLAELDISALAGGGTVRYDRSTTLPSVSGDGASVVLYSHRG